MICDVYVLVELESALPLLVSLASRHGSSKVSEYMIWNSGCITALYKVSKFSLTIILGCNRGKPFALPPVSDPIMCPRHQTLVVSPPIYYNDIVYAKAPSRRRIKSWARDKREGDECVSLNAKCT